MARITKTQLIRLQKKFKTDAKIGEQYNITRQAVHQLRKKYDIESVIAKNAERNQKIISAYESGVSGTTLAKKFKLSISQTYRIINESKKSARKLPKKSAKKVVKKAVKKTVKKAAKKTTKKTPKKATKKVVKKAAKKAVKKTVKKAPKKTTKKVVKKTAKKVAKKAVKKTAKKKTVRKR